MRSDRRLRGFTLIELMIVVSIIALLAAIAIPKFADTIRAAKEGATKGSLGAVRSALSIYFAAVEGFYPTYAGANYTVLAKQRFLQGKFVFSTPNYHDENNTLNVGLTCDPPGTTDFDDCLATQYIGWANSWDHTAAGGRVMYVGYTSDPTGTSVLQDATYKILCTHTDSKGSNYTEY